MNKQSPHIKILILNWNGEKIINECLSSLQNINYNNYSIDVIDNGSSDDSINVITNNYNKVNIHKINRNVGYSRGYNIIFKKLKDENFDYYLLLNNDVYVNKNILKELNDAVSEFGENNIYGSKINYSSDESKIWYAGGYLNKFLGLAHHIGINKYEDNIKYKTNKTDYVSGCCMLIKKELINKLDGFNARFKMYYEDVDLCYRAGKLGLHCFFIENALAYHKVSYSIGNNSLKKIFSKTISKYKFIYYHNNLILFIISLFINLMMIPFSFILYLIKK